jgi:hypothetical protein
MVNVVRDGQKVWPTCPECGCRLNIEVMEEWTCLSHFGMDSEKDARGCICVLFDKNYWTKTELLSHIWG